MDPKIIGQKLRDLRGTIPRDAVSKAVGVSVSALSMYENGERTPRDGIKVKLAKFYGKSVETLFFTS